MKLYKITWRQFVQWKQTSCYSYEMDFIPRITYLYTESLENVTKWCNENISLSTYIIEFLGELTIFGNIEIGKVLK